MFIILHYNANDRPVPVNLALVVTYNIFDPIIKEGKEWTKPGTLISCVGNARFVVRETPEEIEVLLLAAGMMAQ